MKHLSQSLLLAFSLLLLVGASAPAQNKLPPAPLSLPIISRCHTAWPDERNCDSRVGWRDKHPYAEVWVGVDQNDETFIVERGRGIRNATVELGKHYVVAI